MTLHARMVVMEYLQSLIEPLVDHPEDIAIKRDVDEMGVIMTLSVNSADMGRVVGRQGNTAKAIRVLLRVWGMAREQRIYLKIVDPPGTHFVKQGGAVA